MNKIDNSCKEVRILGFEQVFEICIPAVRNANKEYGHHTYYPSHLELKHAPSSLYYAMVNESFDTESDIAIHLFLTTSDMTGICGASLSSLQKTWITARSTSFSSWPTETASLAHLHPSQAIIPKTN